MKEFVIKGFNVHSHDLEYYLEVHPLHNLNMRIYNKLIEKGGTNFDIAKVFDEAYFIATKAYHDKYPANNFNAKYNFEDVRCYPLPDGSCEDPYIASWFIAYWIILDSNEGLRTGNKEDFLNCFRNTEMYGSSNFQKWLTDIDKLKGCSTLEEFAPSEDEAKSIEWDYYDFHLDSPTPVGKIDNWEEITNNFEQDYIEYIVLSYSNEDEMEKAINIIYHAWKNKNDLPY